MKRPVTLGGDKLLMWHWLIAIWTWFSSGDVAGGSWCCPLNILWNGAQLRSFAVATDSKVPRFPFQQSGFCKCWSKPLRPAELTPNILQMDVDGLMRSFLQNLTFFPGFYSGLRISSFHFLDIYIYTYLCTHNYVIIYTTVLLYIHIISILHIYIYVYTYLHMYNSYMNTLDVFFWEGKGGIHIHTKNKNKLNWWYRAESESKKGVIHRSPAQKKMTCVSSGDSFGRWAESFVNQSTSHKAQENTCFGNARELQHHSSRLDQWIHQWGRCLPRIIDACMKILWWSLTCPETDHAYTKENWNWKLTGVSRWFTVYSTAHHVNVVTIHVYVDVYNHIHAICTSACSRCHMMVIIRTMYCVNP